VIWLGPARRLGRVGHAGRRRWVGGSLPALTVARCAIVTTPARSSLLAAISMTQTKAGGRAAWNIAAPVALSRHLYAPDQGLRAPQRAAHQRAGLPACSFAPQPQRYKQLAASGGTGDPAGARDGHYSDLVARSPRVIHISTMVSAIKAGGRWAPNTPAMAFPAFLAFARNRTGSCARRCAPNHYAAEIEAWFGHSH